MRTAYKLSYYTKSSKDDNVHKSDAHQFRQTNNINKYIVKPTQKNMTPAINQKRGCVLV